MPVRMMRLVPAVIFALAASMPGYVRAASDSEDLVADDYLTRHVTMWFVGEDEFVRIEDRFRDSTEPLVGRYGPEDDFMADRIEEVYGRVSSILGIDPPGFRVQLEFVPNGNTEDERSRYAAGEWFEETGADYDHRSGTIFMDVSRAGPESLAAGLTIALVCNGYDFTPPRTFVRSALDTVAGSFR